MRRRSNIQLTIVSPLEGLLPRGEGNTEAGNEAATHVIRQFADLRQWVIIDPNRPWTFEQAEQMFANSWCVVIKIHPEDHIYLTCPHVRCQCLS